MQSLEWTQITNLVGDIKEDQIRNIDYFLSDNLGLFMPSTGPCEYSITAHHSHPSYSFILVFDPFSSLFLDQKEIFTKPGQVCAISPNIRHHEVTSSELSRYLAIFISEDFFLKESRAYPALKEHEFRGSSFKPDPSLYTFVKEFMNEYENKLSGYTAVLDSLAVTIVHTLLRGLCREKPQWKRNSTRIEVIRALEFIHAHFAEKVSTEKIASVAGISYSHFSRVFKQETGLSINNYVTQVRLNKAKQMLRNQNQSITETAFACGFSNHAHFTSKFCEAFKLPPIEYKKKLNKV